MVACFDADWKRTQFTPHAGLARSSGATATAASGSPISSTTRKQTLWLQNERYQDTVIIERLVRAARRGVKVHILARPPHTLKAEKLIEGVGGLRIMSDVGAKVHKLKGLQLHAKMLLADGERAIVGSINLAPGSFDARRELAIEVDDAHVVDRSSKVAHHDWENSTPLDLTDEGLLADLEKRGKEGGRRRARARRGPGEGQAPQEALTYAATRDGLRA